METKAFEQALQQRLAHQQRQQLTRVRSIRPGPQRSHYDNGIISFNSNDYLGLANHPDVIRAFQAGADQYGVGSGSAHTMSGHTTAHAALEEQVAQWTQRERAITFSTGYMANLGLLQTLCQSGEIILQDKLNHASLLDAGQLSRARAYRYHHKDVSHCRRLLQKHRGKKCWVVTDSIFSMDGDIAPLSELAQLSAQHQAHLIVDDAHGIGIYGPQGGGSLLAANLTQQQAPVLMGTFGKALGCMGAFVAGSDALIETCLQFTRPYLFTTAMPAAIACAIHQAILVIQREHWRIEQLQQNITYFKSLAAQAKLPISTSDSAIQPLLMQDNDKALALANYLQQHHILVSAIRPPTVPVGTARLRLTLSATHRPDDIERLVETCYKGLEAQAC